MAGLGAAVRRIGIVWQPVPAAIYRVQAPDDGEYRVAVTYLGSDGHVATSVAEVVWHWLRNPATTWTGVQRISPWHLAPSTSLRVEREVAGLFDLPI